MFYLKTSMAKKILSLPFLMVLFGAPVALAGSNYGDFTKTVPTTAQTLIVAGGWFLVYRKRF